MDSPLTASDLANQAKHPLFAGKTWLGSPKGWLLDSDQVGRLDRLGEAALSFYRAIDSLYRKAWSGQSILRNRSLSAPWVANYFDAGKPDWLVKHARSDAVQTIYPAVLRPDLLPTAEGLSLTEWDAVPGGIGLTAHLEASFGFPQEGRMIDSFGEALADAARALGGRQAAMVIVVSEESATYRPEMEWLADELRRRSFSIRVCSPEDLAVRGSNFFWRRTDSVGLSLLGVIRLCQPPPDEGVDSFGGIGKFGGDSAHEAYPGGEAFPGSLSPLSSASVLGGGFERKRVASLTGDDSSDLGLGSGGNSPGAYLDGPTVQGRALSNWMELGQASKRGTQARTQGKWFSRNRMGCPKRAGGG